MPVCDPVLHTRSFLCVGLHLIEVSFASFGENVCMSGSHTCFTPLFSSFQLRFTVFPRFRCSKLHFLSLVTTLFHCASAPLHPQKCQSECGTDNYVFTCAAQLFLCARELPNTQHNKRQHLSLLDPLTRQ